MENKMWKYLVVTFSVLLIVGFSAPIVRSETNEVDRNEEYKMLLNSIDGIIRTVRLGNTVSQESLDALESQFNLVFPDEGNDIRSRIANLSPEVLQGEEGVEELKGIRDGITSLADETGEVGLSFIYEYSMFVILGVSLGLAVVVNLISRTVVDWESVNRVKQKQSDLKDELEKAKEEGDQKKVHKLQKKQQNFMKEHAGTMFSPMKSMLIIFIPFIIVFNLLRTTYGDIGWVVAWMPFRLPWPQIDFFMLGQFFKGPVAALGFFGWYMLSYFGFSQILRKLLVPN